MIMGVKVGYNLTCIVSFTLHTLHSTVCILHTLHSTPYTLQFVYSTLYTPHSTLYTLHTPHFTLYTPHFRLRTLHSSPLIRLRPLLSTLHTSHTTFHTLHNPCMQSRTNKIELWRYPVGVHTQVFMARDCLKHSNFLQGARVIQKHDARSHILLTDTVLHKQNQLTNLQRI